MNNELFNRYALALKDIAKEENELNLYRDQLLKILEVTKNNDSFIKLLSSFNITFKEKEEIIDKVFVNFSINIINFIKIIVRNNRSYYLNKIIQETIKKIEFELNIEEGIIYSTYLLDNLTLNKLKNTFEKKLNKNIEFKNIVDKSLIGGIKIVLKNNIYDASILANLNSLKKALSKGD